MLTPRKWLKNFIWIFGAAMALILLLMVVLDPYFHYHGPLSNLSYRLSQERYINNGIARHFEYDSIITGTSMCQNFKTSEAEQFWGGDFVKMCFSGAGYKEISDNLETALSSHPEVHTVIWGVDYNGFIRAADFVAYGGYPEYLYDTNPLNDVSYIYNKSIWVHGTLKNLSMTLKGEETTSFDEYSSWTMTEPLDLSFFEEYRKNMAVTGTGSLSDEQAETVRESITVNILELADRHPEVDFYLFYPPFSILYFDLTNTSGELEAQLEAEEIVTNLLLTRDNIHLYSYFTEMDHITDLTHYRDKEHYDSTYNTQILRWIHDGYGEITEENAADYTAYMRDTFLNYDYDGIYE